jgi:hypothetical protein
MTDVNTYVASAKLSGTFATFGIHSSVPRDSVERTHVCIFAYLLVATLGLKDMTVEAKS